MSAHVVHAETNEPTSKQQVGENRTGIGKSDQPGTHEAGNIPGYRFITTTTKDGVTIHRFEKITPVTLNELTLDVPENPIPGTPTSVSSTKVELSNTGTVTNGLFTAEVAAILAGLGILIPVIKRKETEE